MEQTTQAIENEPDPSTEPDAIPENEDKQIFLSLSNTLDSDDSVETLSETKTGTGVTWVRGVGPDENQNMVKANPSNGVVEQLHGYGKY